MSSDGIAIRVENLSKCYQIYDRPQDRLKQSIVPRFQRVFKRPAVQYFREFWALKDVSFSVKRGETVGVIGKNGSGKSTLLQIICGTLNLTGGRVETNGRIAALLELGSGFNPDFTGRENVYMNAAVLGLDKDEIDNRFDSIAGFADIGAFLDQPVKTYSSGMMVRLAFAVQAQIAPDILIVDEALAVGDAKFQAKCFERLKQLKDGGSSILLVTHSSEQIVTHCSRALLIDAGRVASAGEPRQVVNRYMDLLFGKERSTSSLSSGSGLKSETSSQDRSHELSLSDDVFATRTGYNPHEYRWGDGRVTILDYQLVAEDEVYPVAVATGELITLRVAIKFNQALVRPIFGLTIKTKEGVTVYGVNSETLETDEMKSCGEAGSTAIADAVCSCRLAPGDYFISLGVATRHGEDVVPHDRRYDAIHFQVRPTTRFFGLVDLDVVLTAQEVKP